jgi:hypothetical protein
MDKTYGEVRKQTIAAQCAAKAAQAAIRQSHDQFITDERPYIWIKDTASNTIGPQFVSVAGISPNITDTHHGKKEYDTK